MCILDAVYPCIVYRGNSVIALKRKKALLCCSVIVISKSS